MKLMNKWSLTGSAIILGLSANLAFAAEVTCPGSPVYGASPNAECWDQGNVPPNVSGMNGVTQVDGTTYAQRIATAGLQLPTNVSLLGEFDDDVNTGMLKIVGGSSGTWEIVGGSIIGDFFLLLKSASGPLNNPDWVAFKIAAGTLSGTWSISDPSRDLSHASLYGEVPLPAAAWLMISGLLGLFGISRRRRSGAAA